MLGHTDSSSEKRARERAFANRALRKRRAGTRMSRANVRRMAGAKTTRFIRVPVIGFIGSAQGGVSLLWRDRRRRAGHAAHTIPGLSHRGWCAPRASAFRLNLNASRSITSRPHWSEQWPLPSSGGDRGSVRAGGGCWISFFFSPLPQEGERVRCGCCTPQPSFRSSGARAGTQGRARRPLGSGVMLRMPRNDARWDSPRPLPFNRSPDAKRSGVQRHGERCLSRRLLEP